MRREGRGTGARFSALWGTGTKGGESRSRLRAAVVVVALAALALPVAAAGNGRPEGALVDPLLAKALVEQPDGSFAVIVQARRGGTSRGMAEAVGSARRDAPGKGAGLGRIFQSVDGVSAELSAKQIERLARHPAVATLTLDIPLRAQKYSNDQAWPNSAQVPKLWGRRDVKLPAIAVIDSGVEAGRADFGGRVIEQVVLASGPHNRAGDGRGHGTFVASIAAGGADRRTGGAPGAPIVSIDVIDDAGAGLVSDVIAGADWVLANRTRLDIGVVNLSLNAAYASTFVHDPLAKAVERLWLAGLVVVVSAGNHAVDGAESGVPFSPANDPWVITVGAVDVKNSGPLDDDTNAPWSAWGYTLDGFAKPELGAPGRFMIGAVPTTSTLYSERPANVYGAGYMQLSGTSFAAPVVASAAAWARALNPTWTPDQVKGALMVSAAPLPRARARSVGVGMVRADSAWKVLNPPNPNAGLRQFVVPDPSGSPVPVFDAAAWHSAAQASAAWNSAAWNSAAWNSAAWNSAAWGSAAWNSAAWGSAAWGSAAWNSAAWSSAAWSSAAWNNAVDDRGTSITLTTDQLRALELVEGVDLDGDGIVGPAL
jgi:serine protease AprX